MWPLLHHRWAAYAARTVLISDYGTLCTRKTFVTVARLQEGGYEALNVCEKTGRNALITFDANVSVM